MEDASGGRAFAVWGLMADSERHGRRCECRRGKPRGSCGRGAGGRIPVHFRAVAGLGILRPDTLIWLRANEWASRVVPCIRAKG